MTGVVAEKSPAKVQNRGPVGLESRAGRTHHRASEQSPNRPDSRGRCLRKCEGRESPATPAIFSHSSGIARMWDRVLESRDRVDISMVIRSTEFSSGQSLLLFGSMRKAETAPFSSQRYLDSSSKVALIIWTNRLLHDARSSIWREPSSFSSIPVSIWMDRSTVSTGSSMKIGTFRR